MSRQLCFRFRPAEHGFLALLLAACSVSASTLSGTAAAVGSCAARDILPCETVYAVKVGGFAYDDWQFDLTARGGGLVGFDPGDVAGPSFALDDGRFTWAPAVGDVSWVIVSPFLDEIAFFSSELPADLDMGLVRHQLVGDSPPLPASAGIVIPTDGSAYVAPTAMGPRSFPMSTTTGRVLAFAPLADLVPAPGACGIGGYSPDPATGRGIVSGYNIYRRPGTRSSRPSIETMIRSGYHDHLDLDTFDMGSASAPDLDRSDLFWFLNPDGLPYTGDEVVYYADSVRFPDGSARYHGPVETLDYWYFIQPVFRGSLGDFFVARLDGELPQDLVISWHRPGGLDAVDVDGDGVPEFNAPSRDGLGLVNFGSTDPSCPPRPLRMIFAGGALSVPLAAAENVRLSMVPDGTDAVLTIELGSETGSVEWFEVHRVRGLSRVRVNDEPILCTGMEGSSYEVRDAHALAGRGLQRELTHVVTLHLAGGSTQVTEPFTVLGPARNPGRR